MSFIISLLMMGIACQLFSHAFGKKPEETLCVVFCSVIVILYPFYCLDILSLGRHFAYFIFFFVILSLTVMLIREDRFFGIKSGVIGSISPGIVIFGVLVGLYLVFLRGNKVELWDELRLWGAVPKALYGTESLQLGKDALIFPIMQSYPPAMPLFVYFLTALAPEFPEYQIFVAYAVFFSALILPAFKELNWKQWPLFVGIGVLIVWVPCIFTSHGGDYDYFYESLFIDPVLGAMAGYVFFLSATKPFSSGFNLYRFGVALIVLSLLKDSGIIFAAAAVINAVLIEGKQLRKTGARVIMSIIPMVIAYGIWKFLLGKYGVDTASSSHLNMHNFTEVGLRMMVNNLRFLPMVWFSSSLTCFELRLSFVICAFGLAALSIWLTAKHQKQSMKGLLVSGGVMASTFAVFLLGNVVAFGEGLPSFQRYASSLMVCLLVFVVLWVLPNGCCLIKFDYNGRSLATILCITMLTSTVLLGVSARNLREWKEKKIVISTDEYSKINSAVSQIQQNESQHGDQYSNYYLLISDEMVYGSRIHHRIYFDLLGTTACVRNGMYDTNVIGRVGTPDYWTEEDIKKAAGTWGRRLLEEGYEYVCAVSVNDFTSSVLEEMGVPRDEVRGGGTLYAVLSFEDRIILQCCN